jgi:hypothetical protein
LHIDYLPETIILIVNLESGLKFITDLRTLFIHRIVLRCYTTFKVLEHVDEVIDTIKHNQTRRRGELTWSMERLAICMR